jgi:hypothetical protein
MFFSHSYGEPKVNHETSNVRASANTSPSKSLTLLRRTRRETSSGSVGTAHSTIAVNQVFIDSNSLMVLLRKRHFLSPLQFTVELHLSGLIGAASHPDTQKIRIIRGFF